MVYTRRGYGTVRKNPLRSFTLKGRRKRASLATRAKYQRPSAKNQKRQIVSLAKQVAKNTAHINSQKVFTDFQWGDLQAPSKGIVQAMSTGTWYAWPLTDFSRWGPVLRTDSNVMESSKTYCVRCQLNVRCNIGDVSQLAYVNVFVVTPRKDAIDSITLQPPTIGQMQQLVQGTQFIESNQNEGANVRLNTSQFKVHAAKYITLTPNAPTEPLPQGQSVGNPFATWRKWQWNIPLKFSVRMPVNRPWHNIPLDDMAYYQRFYLLAYATHIGGTTGPLLYADSLTTCINFA